MNAGPFQRDDLVGRVADGSPMMPLGSRHRVVDENANQGVKLEGLLTRYDSRKFKLIERPSRSCQSCALHSPSGSLDDVPGPCWPCSRDPAHYSWQPITVTSSPPPQLPTEPVPTPSANPLDTQVGGSHYKDYPIQPVEYSMANKLDACQHSVVKYVTRFRDKGSPIKDLEKARHFIDMLIAFENAKQTPATPKA